MNGYKGFYCGKTADIYAANMFAAKEEMIRHFKVPRSKQGLISVVLCEVADKEVAVSTASLG